ncbi:SET domain-containing protein [Effusibacillus consociatus]|uniref:SET domain-containing protein n=1 Tax=Effusibacillus consociatus TaxID=1117041 RepID=A0ABV9QAW1_9BACL
MIHPHTELRYINEKIGFGVFAAKFIPKGTITWVLDELDQILDPSYVASLDPDRRKLITKYSYRNQEGKYILCWDLGRFVNHSFHANSVGTAYDFEIAVRDIYPGEEITNDYGSLNLDEPFDCFPEEGTDRTCVMPDDLLRFYEEWDQKALDAFRYFNQVEQPLAHLIRPECKEKVKMAADRQVLIDSIRSTYYDRSSINNTRWTLR